MTVALNRRRIIHLLSLLNERLRSDDEQGELYLVGGAVMCLVLNARESTQDIDSLFRPAATIRKHAKCIAKAEDLPDDWLNDGVKGFLSPEATWDAYLHLSHLKVLTASSEYLLAMKCLAMRLGGEFHDEADVRFLLRSLNLTNYEKTLSVIGKYYPLTRFPAKSRYALEELLESDD